MFHKYLVHVTKKWCPQIKSDKVFLKVEAIGWVIKVHRKQNKELLQFKCKLYH